MNLEGKALTETPDSLKNEEQIESIFIYILTEICKETLFEYLDKKKIKIQSLKKSKQKSTNIMTKFH